MSIMKSVYKQAGGMTGNRSRRGFPGAEGTYFPIRVVPPSPISPDTPPQPPSILDEFFSGSWNPPPGADATTQGAGGVIAPGLPQIDVTQGLDKIYEDALAYSADPTNIPQYYTGPTVAQFDPLQTEAQEGLRYAAGRTDSLTDQLLGDYQQQLDPGSALNQQLAQQAAQEATSSYFGAGTPGSQRNQYAANLAAQDAQRASRDKALQNIGSLRGSLTAGSDILGRVGGERQDLSQAITDEDIKRFNYAQLSPQEQLNRLLGIASQQEALKQGNVGFDAGGSSGVGGIFGNILGSALSGGGGGGGILNSIGSALFGQDGGMVPGEVAPMDPMMDPMMPPAAPPGAPLADPMVDSAGPMPSAAPEMMPPEPMGAEMMQVDMLAGPKVSEIDKAEGILQGLAAASGGALKVTRKTKGGKKK